MTIEQAIKKAVEGEWECPCNIELPMRITGDWLCGNDGDFPLSGFFLDPAFWQSFVKGMGVGAEGRCADGYGWQDYWHSFIDTLAQGKTPESFFEQFTS